MTSTLARGLLLAVCSCCVACQSSKAKSAEPTAESAAAENAAKPYDPRVWDKGPPDAFGAFLADLDKSMRAWTNLTLTAQTHGDKTKPSKLQTSLMARVHARQAELVDALETGPPRNRAIAAGALGFSASKDARGPLIVALADRNSEVVQNAALSLALLQQPETPLEPLIEVFQGSTNGQARANAGYALRNILEAGATPNEALVQAARHALVDTEPFAQAQGALILAVAKDGESVPDLGELLHLGSPLVISAATQALVALGRGDPKLLGPTARALVIGLGTCPKEQRNYLLSNLVELSGHNYGDDVKAWTEWSQRLP